MYSAIPPYEVIPDTLSPPPSRTSFLPSALMRLHFSALWQLSQDCWCLAWTWLNVYMSVSSNRLEALGSLDLLHLLYLVQSLAHSRWQIKSYEENETDRTHTKCQQCTARSLYFLSMGPLSSQEASASSCESMGSIVLASIGVQSRGAQLPVACISHGRDQWKHMMSFKAHTRNCHISLLSTFYFPKQVKH